MDNQKVEQVLKEIFDKCGKEIVQDRKKFIAAVFDLLDEWNYKDERIVLKHAVESDALPMFLATAQFTGDTAEQALERLKKESHMRDEDAEFVVRCVVAASGGNPDIVMESARQWQAEEEQRQREEAERKRRKDKRKKAAIAVGAAVCAALCVMVGVVAGKGSVKNNSVVVSNQYNNENASEYIPMKDADDNQMNPAETVSEEESDYTQNILMEDKLTELITAQVGSRHITYKNLWVLGNEELERSSITKITFLNTLADMPDDAWDVSRDKNGLVMAWVKPLGSAGYDLYIAAEGGIQASSGHTLFAEYQNVTEINFNNCFYTNEIRDMGHMFEGCKSLTSLDVSNFETGNVTDMGYMFEGCASLIGLDVSSFDTGNVTDMSAMFEGCASLTGLDVSNFDTGNVTDMSWMFWNCSSLTGLDVSNFDTSNATGIVAKAGMFGSDTVFEIVFEEESESQESDYTQNILMEDKLTATNENGSLVRENLWVFGNEELKRTSITKITFLDTLADMPDDAWDVSQDKNGRVMAWVESSDSAGYDLYIAAEGGIQAGSGHTLFAEYRNVTEINFNNCFYTDEIRDMGHMFEGCMSLTSLDVSNFETGNVTDMSWMFQWCMSLTSLDVSNFETGNVTDMSRMFDGCVSLTSLDVSNFETGNVTDMSGMFHGCLSLTSLDVSNFETNNVTNMSLMFNGCFSLTSLDVSSFETGNVTDMSAMFRWCERLTSLDVSNFETGNVTDMSDMFTGSGITAEQAGMKQ